MPEQLKLPPLSVRAAIVPGTLNDKERSVDVCFATDNPIRIRTWDGVIIYEILSFDEGHCRMERLNAGAPLLDNHNRWGKVSEAQLGVVEKAWIKGGKGYAKVRFSKRDNVESTYQDVRDGIIQNVSVGYNVFVYERTTTTDDNSEVTYRAIDWEPAEISMTPIPADIGAGVRSDDANNPQHFQTVNIVSLNSRTMPDALPVQPEGGGNQPTTVEGQRAAVTTPAPTPPNPAPPVPAPPVEGQRSGVSTTEIQTAVADGIRAERERSTQIRSACQTAGLSAEFATTLIENGSTIDQARAAILTEWQTNGAPSQRNHTGSASMTGPDATDHRRRGMSDALLLRSSAHVLGADGKPLVLDDNSRQYRHMTLMDMAKDVLSQHGFNTRGLSNREIASLALQSRSMMSTSDFPIILGNTVNRALRAAYELQPRTFMPFCSRGTAKDFREMTRTQLSEIVGNFDEVQEGGEYQYATLTEGKEVYKVVKYGKLISITWETLINDDLNAFSRIPRSIASKAAQKQSDIVWSILTGTHTMGDGVALFHADHNNLAASGAAISETTLSTAREKMRTQKDLNGQDFINITPRYLLCGPAKETEAQKILQAVIVATKTSDTNVFKGFVDMIVEPRITGNAWFLSADPMQVDTIEYSFLDGEGEIFTEQKEGFEVDGVTIKARMVFGAKALDYRGFWKNAGN